MVRDGKVADRVLGLLVGGMDFITKSQVDPPRAHCFLPPQPCLSHILENSHAPVYTLLSPWKSVSLFAVMLCTLKHFVLVHIDTDLLILCSFFTQPGSKG